MNTIRNWIIPDIKFLISYRAKREISFFLISREHKMYHKITPDRSAYPLESTQNTHTYTHTHTIPCSPNKYIYM